jgi:hypothetical protein
MRIPSANAVRQAKRDGRLDEVLTPEAADFVKRWATNELERIERLELQLFILRHGGPLAERDASAHAALCALVARLVRAKRSRDALLEVRALDAVEDVEHRARRRSLCHHRHPPNRAPPSPGTYVRWGGRPVIT